jgi:hypothetical protein
MDFEELAIGHSDIHTHKTGYYLKTILPSVNSGKYSFGGHFSIPALTLLMSKRNKFLGSFIIGFTIILSRKI